MLFCRYIYDVSPDSDEHCHFCMGVYPYCRKFQTKKNLRLNNYLFFNTNFTAGYFIEVIDACLTGRLGLSDLVGCSRSVILSSNMLQSL